MASPQGNAFGSVILVDSSMTNVTNGILTSYPASTQIGIVLERFTATSVQTITAGLPGKPTGTLSISAWAQGAVYVNSTLATNKQQNLPLTRPDAPLFTKPRLWDPPAGGSAVVNVYSYGAVGDGVADDTHAIQQAIAAQPASGAVFLPQGRYRVTATITLRADSFLIGEALSEIHPDPTVALWQDASNPNPVVLLPTGGSPMLSEIIFVTVGNVPGAVMLQWQSGPSTALWDVHWRIMHTTWAMGHIVGSSAGGLLENSWAWVADHNIDSGANIVVLNPRGVLVEGINGPLYLYGSASEHSQLYQYNFTAANNVVQLIAQTEAAYNQLPVTGLGCVWSHSNNMRLYGGAHWNWNCQFFNNQAGCNTTALFEWESSSGTVFGLNTHGSNTVTSGDIEIPANVAPTMSWFTSAAIAIYQEPVN
jgi:glucan 1,3-beta-glucosidase